MALKNKGSTRMFRQRRLLFTVMLGLVTSVAVSAFAQDSNRHGASDDHGARRPPPGAPPSSPHTDRGHPEGLPPRANDTDRPNREPPTANPRPPADRAGNDSNRNRPPNANDDNDRPVANFPGEGNHGRLDAKRRERDKRYAELRGREGKSPLSATEQGELKQLTDNRKVSQRLQEKEKSAEIDRNQRREQSLARARNDFNGRLPGDADTVSEFKKNSERLARLERAREVALEKSQDDLIKRIDTMKTMEQKRHDDWVAQRKASK
jgi:hypothetical protein